MIYENFHNVDLEKIVDLKFAKEIWDKLHILYGNNNGEVKKRRKKKKKNKGALKKESQPKEINPHSVSPVADKEK